MAKTLWIEGPDAPGGNYQQGVADLVAAGALADLGPGVFHLTVTHDSDCGIFHGGACDCSPDFELKQGVG